MEDRIRSSCHGRTAVLLERFGLWPRFNNRFLDLCTLAFQVQVQVVPESGFSHHLVNILPGELGLSTGLPSPTEPDDVRQEDARLKKETWVLSASSRLFGHGGSPHKEQLTTQCR